MRLSWHGHPAKNNKSHHLREDAEFSARALADYVPIRTASISSRIALIIESAVIRPVFGFSLGMFSISTLRRPNSPWTSISWQLRLRPGTTEMLTSVRSGPMPARLNAADTLRLSGKPRTASRASRRSFCGWPKTRAY